MTPLHPHTEKPRVKKENWRKIKQRAGIPGELWDQSERGLSHKA